MRKWGGGYKKRTSGGIVSLFNFGKDRSTTGIENQKMREFGNQQMGSDKKGFLTSLTCRTNWTGLSYRRKTKNIKSELEGFLAKKGCKEGGGSLQKAYRKLIRILDDWYRKGV